MKAERIRLDAHYEVLFSHPAFGQMGSFAQIIEPIYNAISPEVSIPSDAIKLESGNTIANTGVTLTLFSGCYVFRTRLDGYDAYFTEIQSQKDIEQAKRYTKLFENAIRGFFTDSVSSYSKLVTSSWLTIDGGFVAADSLVRGLTSLPDACDPFQIGAKNTSSTNVEFECFNNEQHWKYVITVARSALPEADLFLGFSGQYDSGCPFDSLDKKLDHITAVTRSIVEKLNLEADIAR